MSDLFLRLTGVHNAAEAMSSSLRTALRRNKTYQCATQSEKSAFRLAWGGLIEDAAGRYVRRAASDVRHCKAIADIAESLSRSHGNLLVGGRVRFGTSQKAFNLYLKFLWRLRRISTPRHCPIDGIILREAGLRGSWTQSDCQTQYMEWVLALRRKAAGEDIPLSEWEHRLWNKLAKRRFQFPV